MPKFNPTLPITLKKKKKKKALRRFIFLHFLCLQTLLSLSLALSLFLSLALTENNEAQQTQHWDHRVSLLWNHIYLLHSKPPRCYGGEGGGGEQSDGEGWGEEAERMGSEAMKSSAHLTNLTYPAPISPAHHRSRLPTSLISPTQHRSLFSLSFFFFLPPLLTNLAWVFLLWLWVDFLGLGCCGFYFCGCGLALR